MNSAKINDILKYVIYGAIFLVPFIPFLTPGFLFFPFITGKAFVFRVLVELMVGAWAILALRKPEYRPKKSWIIILASVFVGIIALADISGVNPLKSVWSNFERMEGLVLMVHLLGFLFVTSSVLTEKIWHRFFNVSIIASIFMSFYGFIQMSDKLVDKFQIYGGGDRIEATFGNSAYLAVYMLIHIFLTLFLLFRQKNQPLLQWFYGFVIALQTIILYNTATRGALLGLVGGLIVSSLFVIIFERENLAFRKICIGSFAGFVILIGLFIGLKESNFVQNSSVLKRFASISLQESTTKSRFMVWNMAWQGFKEKPVLGWGQENFNYVFNKHYNPEMYNQEQWFDRTHNVFFDWLIAGGLLGLLGYLSLFGALIYYLVRDKNNKFSVTEKAIFIGMLTAYFIHNFFVFDHLISYILFFSFLGYIHSLNVDEEESSQVVDENVNRIAIPVLIVLTIFSLYFFNAKGILASTNLINAINPNKSTVEEMLVHFKTALAYNYSKQEVNEQLIQFAVKLNSPKIENVDPAFKKEVAKFAIEEALKMIEKDPNNARTEFILGASSAGLGEFDLALAHLKRASELSPSKESILVVIGNVYLNIGDMENSLIYLKRAYELGPEFENLKAFYAMTAIYDRDYKLVEEILGSEVIDDEKILSAYLGTKRYDKAIEILELRVKNKPNDPQALLSLGAVYLDAGYKTKSIQIIKNVIEMDPNFRERGEYYINQIIQGLNPTN